jgi:hypothetical protein
MNEAPPILQPGDQVTAGGLRSLSADEAASKHVNS